MVRPESDDGPDDLHRKNDLHPGRLACPHVPETLTALSYREDGMSAEEQAESAGKTAGMVAGALTGAELASKVIPVPFVGPVVGAVVGGAVGSEVGQRLGRALIAGGTAFVKTLTS
jgi:phage tail tape-measure protein